MIESRHGHDSNANGVYDQDDEDIEFGQLGDVPLIANWNSWLKRVAKVCDKCAQKSGRYHCSDNGHKLLVAVRFTDYSVFATWHLPPAQQDGVSAVVFASVCSPEASEALQSQMGQAQVVHVQVPPSQQPQPLSQKPQAHASAAELLLVKAIDAVPISGTATIATMRIRNISLLQ